MSEDKVTLWGAGTMRTHRPIWFAREMGVDFDLKGIGSRTGETKDADYMKINPRHKVPSLVHGDLVVTESAAILNYLNEAFDAPDDIFTPATPAERAQVLSWSFFNIAELDSTALYSIRRHKQLKDEYGDSPIAVKAGEEYFLYQLACMEEAVRDAGPYLMGEKFGIADVLLMSNLDCGAWMGITLPDFYRDWQTRIGLRPAYLETFPLNYGERPIAEMRN
jgi:glutathione S-transferase